MATPPPTPDHHLLTASKAGDPHAIRSALRDGARVTARDAELRTPLLHASLGSHVEAARLLVAAGADPNAQDLREDNAWLVTGVTGNVAMMRTLLSADPAPDLKLCNRFGGISVFPASERGHVTYVRAVLTETDTDVDHVNRLGWTALLEAVILGDGGRPHQEVVEALLAAGATPTLADNDGVTPLTHAERRGFDGIARLIRDAS
ncbi:hypothetical protein OG897_02850 [Streptomyces sp. NBC_00237]|uniref:ankyrin repeat domain-containing protein n=1 Tax=Streptomyces sp. NBC_00237 TaxID=2975687 RepID=UPI002254B75C|nr:ankyrin repeat domain-containing protein [Streptomyces sp. NBC_00237]MCX5200403.1 hypothetical protein [Streptomyces sp. NBC_00237]